MPNIKLSRFPLLALFVVLSAFIYAAATHTTSQANDTAAVSGMNEEELGAFIYDYLMENPGVIIEAVEKYRANQEIESAKMVERKLSENKNDIYDSAHSPSIGNPDADIVIVEFFDYNCGYCKRAVPDIQALLKSDKNIRVVFKDMPILSPASRTASLWALAADKQGKYWDYHVALMKHSGNKTETTLEKLAKDVGLDVKKLKADAKDPALEEVLNNNLALSRDLGIRGTPAFIINDVIERGYVGLESLQATIRTLREEKG